MGKTDNIRSELQQCCSSAIRSRIFQVKRDKLTIITEADLLAAIKLACVNKVSKTTHRNQFFGITQCVGESPQSCVARIKAKESLCDFRVVTKCSATCTKNTDVGVSYSDDAIQNEMIEGFANPDHRLHLLKEGDKYPTLQDKLKSLDTIFQHEKEQQTNPTTEASSLQGVFREN